MEENLKVGKNFKKDFNLGYELANELDLKTPLVQNQKDSKVKSNALQLGIMQYLKESQQQKERQHQKAFGKSDLENDERLKL